MKSNNTQITYSTTDRFALYTKINEESRDSIDRELCDHILFLRWKINQILHSSYYQVWAKTLILSHPIGLIVRRNSRQLLFEVKIKNEINKL